MSTKAIESGDATLCTESFGRAGDPVLLLIMGQMASMLWWPDGLCQAFADEGGAVHRPGVAAVQAVHQLVAREHLVRPLQERQQQLELAGGQLDDDIRGVEPRQDVVVDEGRGVDDDHVVDAFEQ